MNTLRMPEALAAVRPSRTGNVRPSFFARLKNFLSGSDELPDLHLFGPPSPLIRWHVNAALVQHTPFGVLSASSECRLSAASEVEALKLATAEIQQSYPGYAIASLTARQAGC